jgi:hypothetical protein
VQCAVGGIAGQHTDVGESVDGEVGPELVLQQRLMDDEPAAENDRSGETEALGNGGHQCGQRGGRVGDDGQADGVAVAGQLEDQPGMPGPVPGSGLA